MGDDVPEMTDAQMRALLGGIAAALRELADDIERALGDVLGRPEPVRGRVRLPSQRDAAAEREHRRTIPDPGTDTSDDVHETTRQTVEHRAGDDAPGGTLQE